MIFSWSLCLLQCSCYFIVFYYYLVMFSIFLTFSLSFIQVFFLHFFFQSYCPKDYVRTCSAIVLFAGSCLNMFGSRYVRSIMCERVLSFCFSSCSPRIPPTLAPATTACTSTWERSTFWKSERVSPIRRINTEENATVVAAVWGAELLQFLAKLAIWPRTILKIMMKSSFSFKSFWCISSYSSNRPVQNS